LGVVNPEEVNENYGYFSKHPIAERLKELLEENSSL
jgi:hypothetical protein